MTVRPTNNDLWAALLDIQVATPTLAPSVRRALGGKLRERYGSTLDAPATARILGLLQYLAEGTVSVVAEGQASAPSANSSCTPLR